MRRREDGGVDGGEYGEGIEGRMEEGRTVDCSEEEEGEGEGVQMICA